MKKFKLTKNKGITLIALVVTIIVLIILAGVSLALVFGENGMITKSKDAKQMQDIARITEKLELLKGPILIDKTSINLNEYLEILEEKTEEYKINYVERVSENNAYAVLEGKYKFLITNTENGNVIITYEGLAGQLELSEVSGTYKYPEIKTFMITKNESEGALSVTSLNDEIATATINENIVTVKSGTTTGTTKIIVTCRANNGFAKNTATYTATVQNGTLEVTVTPYDGIYDLEAHGITVACTQDGATIEYSNDGITYSSEKPTYTDVGIYTTYYRVVKAGYETLKGSSTITIKCKTTKCEGPFTSESNCTVCSRKRLYN